MRFTTRNVVKLVAERRTCTLYSIKSLLNGSVLIPNTNLKPHLRSITWCLSLLHMFIKSNIHKYESVGQNHILSTRTSWVMPAHL